MLEEKELMDQITEFYLRSRDFNGIPFWTILKKYPLGEDQIKETLKKLIQKNNAAIVFGDIHPNPHIKAFKEEEQEIQLNKMDVNNLTEACIYPTASYLKEFVDHSIYANKPFTLKLALGEPCLSFYSFDLSVLEYYFNDPRYIYRSNDISGMISYKDDDMKESDQVLLESFGFSYGPNGERAVAVFLSYLSRLSPEHQQIWKAKLLSFKCKLHPDYFRSAILGEWPKGVSIFDAFVEELHHINEMCKQIGKAPLFNNEYREDKKPKEFCFMLRTTSKQYNEFVELLDKMVSQNLNYGFFSDEIPTETEDEGKDGKIFKNKKGTIQLLREYLDKRYISDDRGEIENMINNFKYVRQLRREASHKVHENAYDQKYYKMQRELITNTYSGIRLIRMIFANHPALRNYKVQDWLYNGDIWNC